MLAFFVMEISQPGKNQGRELLRTGRTRLRLKATPWQARRTGRTTREPMLGRKMPEILPRRHREPNTTPSRSVRPVRRV